MAEYKINEIQYGSNIYKLAGDEVELTQAEYDALSTAQKNNGTTYFITDADAEDLTTNSLVAFTPTLRNGFTVASWGGIHGYKLGKMCVVNFHGIQRSQEVTSELIIASIPYTTISEGTSMLSTNGSDNANIRISKNDVDIFVNSLSANTAYMGQIVFFVGE